ncbi:hypothetical protein HGRIS_012322 [Hohenbuehelia grisea]|uniref:F-box domain-containing protein n=1 Tax=Hohenbuehelia grisea TaxID=104357 RepID=A0ABR3IRZ7_9AGAR
MHRCLLVDEIFLNIVDNLEINYRTRSLAVLARTCRALKQRSLAKLWSEIDTLLPLLKLIPQNAWAVIPDGYISDYEFEMGAGRGVFHSRRELTPGEDWARFNIYAPLIRSFKHYDDYQHAIIHPDALYEISLHKSNSPFLPQLRSFSWNDEAQNTASFVQLFSSPSVTQLKLMHFQYRSSAAELTPSLKALALSCPNLESFEVSGVSERLLVFLLAPRAANKLPFFTSLKSLTLLATADFAIPQFDLLHINAYPQLESLSLTFDNVIPNCASSISSTSLRKLMLSYFSLTTKICDFCRSLQLPQLSELTLKINGKLETALINDICLSISKFDNLSALRIHSMWGDPIITLFDIQPLLDLRGLRELHLSVYSLRLGDQAITSISKAFPSLRRLYLLASSQDIFGRRPDLVDCTLAGLEALSSNCRHLKELAARIDTANMLSGFLDHDDPQRARNTALTRLDVGESLETDPGPTAKALAAVFPSLKQVDSSPICPPGFDSEHRMHRMNRILRGWRDVNRLLSGAHASIENRRKN